MTVAMAVLLALSPVSTGGSSSSDINQIPVEYHGHWRSSQVSCEEYWLSDDIFAVGANLISFYDGGVEVDRVEQNGNNPNIVNIQGRDVYDDGISDPFEYRLILHSDGQSLEVQSGDYRSTHRRCLEQDGAQEEDVLLQQFEIAKDDPERLEGTANLLIRFYLERGRYSDAERISAEWVAEAGSMETAYSESSPEQTIAERLTELRLAVDNAEETYGARAAETLAALLQYARFARENYMYEEAADASIRIGGNIWENLEEQTFIYQTAGRFIESEELLYSVIGRNEDQDEYCQSHWRDSCSYLENVAYNLLVDQYILQNRIEEAGNIDMMFCRDQIPYSLWLDEYGESANSRMISLLQDDCRRPSILIAEGNFANAVAVLESITDYNLHADEYADLFGFFSKSIFDLVDVYYSQNEFQRAEELIHRVFDSYNMFQNDQNYCDLNGDGDGQSTIVAGTYDSMHIYFALQALGIHQQLLRDDFGTHSMTGAGGFACNDFIRLRLRLAEIYGRQGRAAESNFILQSYASQTVPSQSAVVTLLADNHARNGQNVEADTLYTLAANMVTMQFGPDNPLSYAIAERLIRTALASNSNLDAALRSAHLLTERHYAAARRNSILTASAQGTAQNSGLPDGLLLLANVLWQSHAGSSVLNDAATAESWTALQDAIVSPAGQAVAQMATQRMADQQADGLGEAVRERDRLAQLLNALYRAALGNPAAASGAANGEIADLESQMAAIDTRLRNEFPRFFDLIRPQAVSLAEAQGLLDESSAILLVVPSEFGTHVVAVTDDNVRWHRSDWSADDVQSAATRLRWDLGATVTVATDQLEQWQAEHSDETPYGFSREVAHSLYGELIAPLMDVLDGKNRLFVVAGDELSGLPFSVLVTEQPSGLDNDAGALRNTAWLADRFALSHIPSVQSLLLMDQANANGRPTGAHIFAGFGDPLLRGSAQRRGLRNAPSVAAEDVLGRPRSSTRGRMAETNLLRRLARLPGTAIEIENLRNALGASEDSVWLGDRATETAVRSADLDQTRIIAFATHGLMPRDLSTISEPGLVFTPPSEATDADDGYLSASEVAALQLNAEWVILSACNTATGDQGSGLSSLARSFIYAGAQNLLASHWPVDDEVASLITVRTLEILRDNDALTRAQAFQRAMIEIRSDTSHDTPVSSWAHPSYWAPFVLIGGIDHDSIR